MQTCDALIVGGGPGGSTCARALRRHGMDVAVIDKAQFPRDKVCAGWITPAVVQTLELDTEAYAKQCVLQPITAFRTSMMGRDQVDTDYGKVVSYGIRRREFDGYLLARAGVRTLAGEPVKTIERFDGKWVVNGAITAPLLIGAGGHFCPIARHLGANPGAQEPAVTAKEIEFEMTPAQVADCKVSPESPELFFCPDLTGYGWCFRKGNHLNIGLGRESGHRLTEHLERFVAQLKEAGRIPADVPDKFHGHAYVLYGHAQRKLLDDGVMLIGDAAGLAYPESGEGIRPAVESAILAARVAIEARGDYRAAQLRPYEALLRERFGTASAPGKSLIPAGLRSGIAAMLMANRWFTRHVVLDRWFLHAQQVAQAPL